MAFLRLPVGVLLGQSAQPYLSHMRGIRLSRYRESGVRLRAGMAADLTAMRGSAGRSMAEPTRERSDALQDHRHFPLLEHTTRKPIPLPRFSGDSLPRHAGRQ